VNVFTLLKPVLRPNVGHLAVLAAIGLLAIGLSAIDTAPTNANVSHADLVTRQLIYAGVGFVVMLIVATPHYKLVGDLAYPIALAVLPLLVVVLIPRMPEALIPVRNGARRWIDIGPIDVQPSELAKIAFVLALARYLRFRENYRTVAGLLVPAVITGVPVLLINREPDLGTSLLFLPALGAMLIAAGARLKHLITIALIGAVIAPPAAYPFLRPYQQKRILSLISQWKGDTKQREAEGYQSYKAKIVGGAGQLSGYGKDDAEKILKFNALPEAHNDMIFAVVCARWGLLGAATVLGLYMLLMFAGIMAAGVNRDPFARLVAVGIVAMIFTQVFVNVGMVIGLLPVTGMTLPLVSYGGSSLLTTFAMIGLLLNTASHRPTMVTRRSFEFAAV
jgi:cell division protein FtsW (lipid II flippase)